MAANREMFAQAEAVSKEMNLDVEIKLITSDNVVEEARKSAQNGTHIIIARGYQAYLVSKYTELPVVKVVLSGQELAVLVSEARQMAAKSLPVIGIVGFKGMFSSTKPFEEIFNVKINEYFVDNPQELQTAVNYAWKAKVDVLIGGELALQYAQKRGIPSLFLKSRVESIEEAFSNAKRVAYAIDLEKRNTAELKTILDYSFDGIIKLNTQGFITVVNDMAEKILGKNSGQLLGKPLTAIFDLPDENMLNQVINENKNLYSVIVKKENLAWVANIVNMTIDNVSHGIFLSFQEFKRIEELEAEIRKQIYAKGYVARRNFDQIIGCCGEMKKVKASAKIYVQYDLPVLIYGELGTGKRFMAESIHNASLRCNNPFIAIDCKGVEKELLQKQLFGYEIENFYTSQSNKIVKGAFELAHGGSVFLEHLSCLDENSQSRLLQVLQKDTVVRLESGKAIPIDVRLICSTDTSLTVKMKQGGFNEELYYRLSVLELILPPLRERKEDIAPLVDFFLKKYGDLYKKYIMLAEEARDLIGLYPWYGNIQQLKLFCEKMIILADKKVIDAKFVNRYLRSFTEDSETGSESKFDFGTPQDKAILYRNPESVRILATLEKHHGNRALVAGELGMSTTTLWRKIKKYHIDFKFDI